MTVTVTAETPTVTVMPEPCLQLLVGAPARVASAEPSKVFWRSGAVTTLEWMAIRQGFYAECLSVADIARRTGVSRRKVRAVLWPFQAA
jgi:hypothetical protein